MSIKKTIVLSTTALALSFGASTGAYANADCGKFAGKGVEKIFKVLTKEATRACAKGTGTTALPVRSDKIAKGTLKAAKKWQKGVNKFTDGFCVIEQATIDAVTAAPAALVPLSQGLADLYCLD